MTAIGGLTIGHFPSAGVTIAAMGQTGEPRGEARRPQRARSTALRRRPTGRRGLWVGCLLLATAVGCADRPRAPAWERVDLWQLPAQILSGSSGAAVATLGFQGPDEVRDLELLTPRDLELVPALRSPRVRALRQQPGSVLAWRLTLGEDPYLGFTPLGGSPPCAAPATVTVVVAGAPAATVWRGAPAPGTPPSEVDVSLARWAGREVELRLAVADGAPCPMHWGSPEVVSRRLTPLPPPGRGERPPSIVLIGADTLRTDALGAYGRQPSLTPALDRLAAESDLWTEAFATVNATNPSFASILTGKFVHHHGVGDLKTPLAASHVTLAERLEELGYDSLAVLAAQHLGPHNSGLDQGFDQVLEAENTSAARLAVDQALAWLAEPQRGERPFLLWLHLFDPHTPHTPPAPYALGRRAAGPVGLAPVRSWLPFREPGPRPFRHPRLAAARELYAGEVAYLDRQVDRLLGFLADRGLLAHTLVAFVADHGENLEDHGVSYRHAGLWDTTTHVPLMIRPPGPPRPGRRLDGLVQTIDLYPTLLAAVGLRPNPQDGRELGALTAEGRGGRPAVFATQADGEGAAVRTRRFRYFLSAGSRIVPDGAHLYDLAADPGELTNLAGQGRPEESELRSLLDRWRRPLRRGPERHDAERDAELRALGYL